MFLKDSYVIMLW